MEYQDWPGTNSFTTQLLRHWHDPPSIQDARSTATVVTTGAEKTRLAMRRNVRKRTHVYLYVYSIHRMYCHDPMASCRCNVGHESSFWKTSTTIDSLESWTLSKPETAMQRMMLWFARFLFTTRASESHRSVLRWRWEAIPGHPRSPRWLLRREDLALRKSTRKSKDSYVTMCNNEKLQNSQDIRDVTLQ